MKMIYKNLFVFFSFLLAFDISLADQARLTSTKTQAYLHEQIPITISFTTNKNLDIEVPSFIANGFFAEYMGSKTKTYDEYVRIDFNFLIFPQSSSASSIPAQTIIVRYNAKSYSLKTNSLPIEILKPKEDKWLPTTEIISSASINKPLFSTGDIANLEYTFKIKGILPENIDSSLFNLSDDVFNQHLDITLQKDKKDLYSLVKKSFSIIISDSVKLPSITINDTAPTLPEFSILPTSNLDKQINFLLSNPYLAALSFILASMAVICRKIILDLLKKSIKKIKKKIKIFLHIKILFRYLANQDKLAIKRELIFLTFTLDSKISYKTNQDYAQILALYSTKSAEEWLFFLNSLDNNSKELSKKIIKKMLKSIHSSPVKKQKQKLKGKLLGIYERN